MRPPTRLFVPLLALLAGAGVAAAQPDSPSLSAFSDAVRARPAGGAVDGAVRNPVEMPDERFEADLLLGLPTGLRVQAVLFDDGRNAWVAEAFAGLAVILPTAGAGVRHRFTLIHEGDEAFRISPGIDIYGAIWPSGSSFGGGGSSGGAAAIVTADADFSWEQTWGGDRWGSEVGLKLGVGAAFVRNDCYPVPVVSLFGGIHF